jgi:ribosomal protein S20
LAHSPRGWTGARTPSAIKRVRQTERRRAINQPRRTAAKTLIIKAVSAATDVSANGGSAEDAQEALKRAVSALDLAAKLGAIHKNAADRRKSRLMLKFNATLGGEAVSGTAKATRQISKGAAAKEAKARIAASRAAKAKGAQTAAGKARAALARTSRDAGSESTATPATETTTTTAKRSTSTKTSTAKTASKATAAKSTGTKATAAKSTAKATTAKATAAKAPSTKTSKTTAKKS